MQIVTPLVLTADMIDSPIPEPDESVDEKEIEWEDITPSYITVSDTYLDVVSLDNGYLYAVGVDVIAKIDTSDNSITIITNTHGTFSTIILADNGYIYGAGTDVVAKINTSDDSATFIVIDCNCKAIAQADNGYLYAVGINDKLAKIDISDDSATSTAFNAGNYFAITPVSNGYLYAAGENSITKIDVSDDSLTDIAVTNTYYSIIQADNGYIYAVGDRTLLKIDPSDDSFSDFFVGWDNNNIIQADDGYLYLAGSNSISKVDADSGEVLYASEEGYYEGIAQSSNRYVYAVGSGEIAKIKAEYLPGDQVILASEHVLYQCTVATNDSPSIGVELTPPSWIAISATNKWRMFDYLLETDYVGINKKTYGNNYGLNGTDTFVLTPGQFATTVSLYGMSNIESVQIDVYEDTIDGTLLYSETQNLELDSPFEDQLVNDALYNSKVFFDEIEAYANPCILVHVTLADSSLSYEIGSLVIGNARTMGVTVYESSTSRTSYDTTTIDSYGNETYVSKASAEYTTFELFVKPVYSDYIERILKDALNKKRVYVGSKNKTDKLFTFGVYERSPISYDGPNENTTTLKVRGLV